MQEFTGPVSANGCCYLVAEIVLDVCYHHHTCPLIGKQTRRRFADAASPAGDYGYFAG